MNRTILRRLRAEKLKIARRLKPAEGGVEPRSDGPEFWTRRVHYEMAERSGVRIVLDGEAFPALPGAITAARRGLVTGGDQRNRDYVAGSVEMDALPDDLAGGGARWCEGGHVRV